MVDRVDKQTRHQIMSAIHGKHTSPEMEVRKSLFKNGFRYKNHDANLPGKPDIVLPKYRTVVFVHGCFWHGHDCRRRPKSKSNIEFWENKIALNKKRDLCSRKELLDSGWRVLIIWECCVRRQSPPFGQGKSLQQVVEWIRGTGRLAILSENILEECL